MKARNSIILSILLLMLVIVTVRAQGSPPTITDIADQNIDEDASTGPLDFTVGDDATPADALVVTGSSSNQSLVPDLNIVIAGTGADKTVTVTPIADQNGTATITLIVTDGDGQTASDTFDVTVVPLNDPPVCNDVNLETDEDTQGSTPPDCTDIDGDPLTYSIAEQPQNGTATTSLTELTFDPDPDFNGSDSFTYKANDGLADSNAATVNVTVAPINDAPECNPVSMTTNEDIQGNSAPDCTDIDGDTLAYSIVAQASHGMASVSSTTPVKLLYDPDPNFNGSDSFTYRANDGTVNSNTASVSVTVNSVNDAPTDISLSNNTAQEMLEPGVLVGTFSTTDVDGGPDYVYSLVTATGCASGGNSSFTISGNNLLSAVTFDFETKNTYNICVRTNDGHGGTFHKSFPITIQDRPKGAITVTPIDQLTGEGGEKGSFEVVLDFVPSKSVSIGLSSNDITEGILLPPTTLTFTPSNWKTPQTVIVQGVDDNLADGPQPYKIITAAAVSLDPDYHGVNPADVNMTNADNDTAGLSVAPLAGLVTTEGGISRMIQVQLNTQPTQSVTVSFSSTKPSEGTVSPTQVTITPSTWANTYEVQVTGADDKEVDGDQNYSIKVSTTSSDPKYNGLKATVSATNRDAPNIEWLYPVKTKQIYDISDLVPFLLRVERSSPEGIAKVRFYRFYEPEKDHKIIGEVFSPPYQLWFDPSLPSNKLSTGYNQFYARAIDSQGDFIDAGIWINVLVFGQRKVFIPAIRR